MLILAPQLSSTHIPRSPKHSYNMFSKLSISALALTLVGVAAAAPAGGGDSGCSTAGAQCCQNVQNSGDADVASLVKSLIGVDVSGLNVPIGTGCSSIDILGGVSW
jgi:hypothetical protein